MKAPYVFWGLLLSLCVTGTVKADPAVPNGYSIQNYASGIGAANGLAIGPDGLLYITDYLAGKLLRRTTSGTLEVVASNIPNASGVAFSPTGRIFVVGGYSDVYEVVAGVPQVFATGFSSLTSIAAKGNDVYVSSSGNGIIAKIATGTGIVTNVLTGIGNPFGLSFDALGNLYYINHAGGQLFTYNFVDPPHVLTNITPSGGVYTGFGFGGQLFWGDYQLATLFRLTSASTPESFATGFAGGASPPAIGPNGIVADGNNAILIADGHNIWRIALLVDQNQIGQLNTADGPKSLFSNTTGIQNSAFGAEALYSNTTGSTNNAAGVHALQANTVGSRNNGNGGYALYSNTTGDDNNAMGYQAMNLNTSGYRNSAVGGFALASNTSGNYNNAAGYGAMYGNTTGSNNNAQGYLALENNTTGNYNIAIGRYAGINLTTGDNNIDIGNSGVAGEGGVIRIGSATATTYISGISTSTITGAAVYVTSSGQLGVLASSERYKTQINPIGSTAKLAQLRPVSFHLKSEPDGTVQYGLIAEEVDKIYPELVIRDTAGKIQGVRYDELAPMLLNEAQQQTQKIVALERQLAEIQATLARLHAND